MHDESFRSVPKIIERITSHQGQIPSGSARQHTDSGRLNDFGLRDGVARYACRTLQGDHIIRMNSLRKTDFGDLVNAGNAGAGRELFHISQNNIVRVFVTVPEEFSKQVKPGTKASMDLTELPNRHFAATVTRTTEAIDASSRTLTVELDVPNPSGELLPGAYANVHFKLPLHVVPLVLPSSAILFQAAGPQVGLVTGQNQVELRKVTLGHDFGDTIEILAGVRTPDSVIANPPDSLTQGMPVAVQSTAVSGKGN